MTTNDCKLRAPDTVIPAQAGIQAVVERERFHSDVRQPTSWIPASAGMTELDQTLQSSVVLS